MQDITDFITKYNTTVDNDLQIVVNDAMTDWIFNKYGSCLPTPAAVTPTRRKLNPVTPTNHHNHGKWIAARAANRVEIMLTNRGTPYNAIRSFEGTTSYYSNGYLHRISPKSQDDFDISDNSLFHEPGPAVIRPNGTYEYYFNGVLHRPLGEGPTIVYSSGMKEYYYYGKLHRENGPAVIYKNGNEEWYKNGKLHREMDMLLEEE
ncbi:MAG: hypothetical protein JKX76_02280 [Colwellia sp.]|nr:hypothetical protein [Colwellia sp.]